MADFQYKSGGVWYPVPDYAHPEETNGQIAVTWPTPTDRDPNNNPCGGFGRPQIDIKSDWMPGNGWAWWEAWFPNETDETTAITLTAYNARRGAWVKYSGTLLRPQSDNCKPSGSLTSTIYSNVVITIQDVTETS